MSIDEKFFIKKLTRLSNVENIKNIPQLTQALFPGTHCPLMGSAMAVGGIKDSMLVVIGTDECAYYTKSMTLNSVNFGGLNGRCVSVVLDDHDVTFGSVKKMYAAFQEIVEEYRPSCVFLVTTCVIEIIGDDYDAIAEELSTKYNIPVMAVHTEHFKCEDHMPGLERTITACFNMMKQVPCDGSVNILGQRLGNFDSTELYQILQQSGIKIGVQLPSGCTVDEIRQAAAAKVNIVVHDIALPLAKEMQNKFGIPYVYFNRFADPEKIYDNYKKFFAYLGIEMPAEVKGKYMGIQKMITEKKTALQGITYIYGNTPYYCFELNQFMISLGMVPLLIQTNKFDENDKQYVENILKYTNPYVCKAANIAPLQYIYDELKPFLYLGHEFAKKLREKGIAILHTDAANNMLGFEATAFLLVQLERAVQEARTYRKELNL